MYTVSTFYQFTDLPDYREWREPLLQRCTAHGCKGSILLATEGINATVAGPAAGIAALLGFLRADARFADLQDKRSYCEFLPFKRMKVRLKQEIVRLKTPGADPRRAVGRYVAPADWNDLISAPDVLLIDTRNDFEVRLGTFKGAVNPETAAFGDFPAYVASQLDPTTHKRVAMFCTGGIRCEKATSLLKQAGFAEVYHLRGGILQYLEDVPTEQSLWQGECFVFDERVALTHDLQPGESRLCRGCGAVLGPVEACGCGA
jgi:UPF0176 protein